MKSFDSALDQPIENMGRRGFGLNRKSHVARGAASGSAMVVFIFFAKSTLW
jgi:hypothetical protein